MKSLFFSSLMTLCLFGCAKSSSDHSAPVTAPTPVIQNQETATPTPSASASPNASVNQKTLNPAAAIHVRKKKKTGLQLLGDQEQSQLVASETSSAPQFTDEQVNAIARSQDDCSPVDLSKNMGDVKNQRSTADCFAYTATELMNYKNRAKVSALATALQYGMIQDPNGLSGNQGSADPNDNVDGLNTGLVASAMQAAQNAGICYEKDIPSRFGDSDALRLMDANYNVYRQSMETDTPEHYQQKAKAVAIAKIWTDVVFPGVIERNFKQFPTGTLDERQAQAVDLYKTQVQTALDNSSSFELYLRNFLALACYRTVPKVPAWGGAIQDLSVDSTDALAHAYSYIHQTLSQQYPIGMGYNTTGLISASGGGHASTIAGRQWQNFSGHPEGCYLLVKNSWGKLWPQAHDLDGLKAVQDPNHMGYFWVKDTDLANSILSFTQIEILPTSP